MGVKSLRSQLFTPFFSTKTNGRGIGLTMIRDILLHHDFPFFLATEGTGRAVFRISF